MTSFRLHTVPQDLDWALSALATRVTQAQASQATARSLDPREATLWLTRGQLPEGRPNRAQPEEGDQEAPLPGSDSGPQIRLRLVRSGGHQLPLAA